MNSSDVFSVLATTASILVLPMAMFAAYAGIRFLWLRGSRMKGAPVESSELAELADLRARVEELERRALLAEDLDAHMARINELEERLDFTERLLAQRDSMRLQEHHTPV